MNCDITKYKLQYTEIQKEFLSKDENYEDNKNIFLAKSTMLLQINYNKYLYY